MRQFILKFTSTLVLLCLLFSFSSCKDKIDDDESSTEIDTTDEISEVESTDEDDSQVEQTDNEVEDTENNVTAEDTTLDNIQTGIAAMPETKQEIVKYYADAVNKVKSSAKSIAKVYTNTINYNQIVEVGNNSTISGIAQSLMGSFLKEDRTRTEYSSATDFVNFFPPKKSQTCNITADMIDTAECRDLGSEYEIKIRLNSSMDAPDVNPPMGGGKAGTAFNIVDTQEILDAAGSMVKLEGTKNSYFDASLTCKIDKKTGNMTSLEQILPSTMEFSKVTAAVIISVNNPKIGLEYHEHWEINW